MIGKCIGAVIDIADIEVNIDVEFIVPVVGVAVTDLAFLAVTSSFLAVTSAGVAAVFNENNDPEPNPDPNPPEPLEGGGEKGVAFLKESDEPPAAVTSAAKPEPKPKPKPIPEPAAKFSAFACFSVTAAAATTTNDDGGGGR